MHDFGKRSLKLKNFPIEYLYKLYMVLVLD